MELDQRSNEQIRQVLGGRLREHRRARQLTQAELAERAGISRPTLSNIERGHDVNLDSFLSALRALNLIDALNAAIGEPAASPIAALRERRSAPASETSDGSWHWGDER